MYSNDLSPTPGVIKYHYTHIVLHCLIARLGVLWRDRRVVMILRQSVVWSRWFDLLSRLTQIWLAVETKFTTKYHHHKVVPLNAIHVQVGCSNIWCVCAAVMEAWYWPKQACTLDGWLANAQAWGLRPTLCFSIYSQAQNIATARHKYVFPMETTVYMHAAFSLTTSISSDPSTSPWHRLTDIVFQKRKYTLHMWNHNT